MNMDWDYNGRKVHISMLNYFSKSLTRFQHQAPSKLQHQPYPHVKPNYGVKAQYTEDTDTSELLPKEDKKFIQELIGTFLYYAQFVSSTMLAALGSIATKQASPTKNTMKKVQQFLDYASTHPDAIVTHHVSDMVLTGHSNTSYLSESKAHSRAGGHFSCPTTQPNHQTMAPSSQSHKLSRRSCPWQQRLRWGLSTSTAEKPSPPTMPSNSWAIPNLRPQCRRTTPLHLALSTAMLLRN